MYLLKRLPAIVFCFYALVANVFGQGSPATLWMREGSYWPAWYTQPTWSADGLYVGIDREFTVDVVRASDGMLVAVLPGSMNSVTAQFQFLPDDSVAVFSAQTNDRVLTQLTVYSSVSNWTPTQTSSFPTSAANNNFLVSADGQFAIVDGNLYSNSGPGLYLTPLTIQFSGLAPFQWPDGSGTYYSFMPSILGDSAFGGFGAGDLPVYYSVSCTTLQPDWSPFSFTAASDEANSYSADMNYFSIVNGAGTAIFSTAPPYNQIQSYFRYDASISWPAATTGYFGMSSNSGNYGVFDESTFSPIWLTTGNAMFLGFSPDGTQLATVPETGQGLDYARLVDGGTGVNVGRLSWAGNRTNIAHSPDGTLVAAGSWTTPQTLAGVSSVDLGIPVFNSVTGALVNTVFAGNGVESVALADDTTLLVAYNNSFSGYIAPSYNLAAFNIQTGAMLWSETVGAAGTNLLSVQVSKSNPSVALAVTTPQFGQFFTFNPHGGAVSTSVTNGENKCRLSPDGTMVLTYQSGYAWISDLNGNVLGSAVRFSVNDMAWSPSGTQVALGGGGGAELFSVSGAGLAAGAVIGTGNIYNVAWSGDGSAIAMFQLANDPATGSTDQQLAIINATTGTQVAYYTTGIDQVPGQYVGDSLDGDATGQTFAFGGSSGLVAAMANPLYAGANISVTLTQSSQTGGKGIKADIKLVAPAPAGGATVTLSSSNPAATLPASVVIPAGKVAETVTVQTEPVSTATPGSITATYSASTASAALTVTPPGVSRFVVTPATAVGGANSSGLIVLDGIAPTGGLSVPISSSNAFASAPSPVVVPAGKRSVRFTVSTTPVATNSNATISAVSGGATWTAAITVTAPTLSSVKVSPASVAGGSTATGTVRIASAAPSSGLTISLSSDSSFASVPANVTILGGALTATFAVTTTPESSSAVATITGSFNASSAAGQLTVTPPSVKSVTMSPASVTGGAGSVGTVNLGTPAPSGGYTVTLASDSAFASVPSSVVVAEGATSATFTVATSPAAVTSQAAITATTLTTSRSATLTVKSPVVTALSMSPTSIVGGTSCTGTVTLSGPAPDGGISVSLLTDSSSATVPTTVTVEPGATTATFTVTSVAVTAKTKVTVSATLGTTRNASLTLTPS